MRLFLFVPAFVLSACGNSDGSSGVLSEAASVVDDAGTDVATERELPSPDGGSLEVLAAACEDLPTTGNTPQTIAELVALLNALPRPLSLSCFLQSLARPLMLNATSSEISAQPAGGSTDPRVFILSGGLNLSVVTEGSSSNLLEVSELLSETRSVKAEIVFPVQGEITDELLAERVQRDDGTVCGLCHSAESLAEDGFFGGAFESGALRPNPNLDVAVADLLLLHQSCDSEQTPARCELMDALYEHGEVQQGTFPEAMPYWAGL